MNFLLANILIEPNVISEKGLEELLNHCKNSSKTDLSVFDPDKTNETGETSWIVDKDIRDTQLIPIEPLFPQIEELFKNIVKHVINPFYGIEVSSSEVPQILRYGVGGHYKPHIDGRSLWISPTGDKIWRKSTDRDLSIVLFLNDDFEGGEFVFPEHNIQIKPKPGMLVAFPSDQNYLHGVNPVTKGERFSIVTWATIKGQVSQAEETESIKQKYGVS